jgi:hypothetical protein
MSALRVSMRNDRAVIISRLYKFNPSAVPVTMEVAHSTIVKYA